MSNYCGSLSSSPGPDGLSLQERLAAKLSSATNALMVGVGGGNDSVTTLLMKYQLARDFGFHPQRTDIAAMLPDVLDYLDLEPTAHPLVWGIQPASKRFVQGAVIRGFPEPLLAKHKDCFRISRVWGISMRHGSEGVSKALRALIQSEGYDLVLAFDVGGAFIAAPENLEVLSPMMDAYALSAFRRLLQESQLPPFVFGVFGLGTDGESTPQMLAKALKNVAEYHIGEFDPAILPQLEPFYRKVIEPNRYSRTADFTLREIHGDQPHENPAKFRARFHTKPTTGKNKSHVAFFLQHFEPSYYGKYFLFDCLDGVRSPFAVPCSNGIEWFLDIQKVALRINHEIQGQAYMDARSTLGLPPGSVTRTLYFGTPSRKFAGDTTARIVQEVTESLRNGVYDMALVYQDDLKDQNLAGLRKVALNDFLAILGRYVDWDVVTELHELVR